LRVFKTKRFGRFQRSENIADDALVEAISRAERGMVDANLGRSLIKQRIARRGQGRSSGFRTVIVFRAGERAVFLLGFAKSGQDNMSANDETDLAAYGALLLGLDAAGLVTAIEGGELLEIGYDH
jgi:hypothetical protein